MNENGFGDFKRKLQLVFPKNFKGTLQNNMKNIEVPEEDNQKKSRKLAKKFQIFRSEPSSKTSEELKKIPKF